MKNSQFSSKLRWIAVLLSTVLLATALSSCATPFDAFSPKPKLLVFLVVDGLPERQIADYRDQLAPDGLARFLERGAWYTNANYGYSFTVTGAGHATVLTGAYPHRSGIIANEWRDAQTGALEYCTADTGASYIGNTTKPLDGTSPKNLKVESVGDVLKHADARSKVISISGKDRGAILPAGKTGIAYMYMSQSGQFASSTFYMKEHPTWVNAFNDRKMADTYFKTQWSPLLPEEAYARSVPDNQPWFLIKGAKLPMLLGKPEAKAPDASFYSSLLRSPVVDAMSLQFARAAIAAEALGQDDAPDILAISLSGHDYVNHAFSAESRISHDHLLQLDRMLQAFFADLDKTVGKDNYIVTLTADHGFMPAPEVSTQRGLDAGRINGSQALSRFNTALESRFGPGKWVSLSGASLLLNKALLAEKKIDANDMAEAARAHMKSEPGFAVAFTRKELLSGSQSGAPYFDAMRKSFHPDVSGDLQFILKPNWMFTSSTAVATHGSPYAYDTNVPILAWGPRWVKPGRVDSAVEVADIAPTVSRWLGVKAPAASEGKLLPLPN